MNDPVIPESLRQHEITGCLSFSRGGGSLIRADVKTAFSAAEIYPHGAHVTGFKKIDEPSLLFLSEASQFAPGKAIRGGVPICFPWFGPRGGGVAHGFARVTEWDLQEVTKLPDGGLTLRFNLPKVVAGAGWPPFSAQYAVTVGDKLTLELIVTNTSADRDFAFENCLHTYFAVGDIAQTAITGLKGVSYLDKVDGSARKQETADAIRISSEVDRVYLDATGAVDIRDDKLRRGIRIEKSGSASTVVWNPWIAKSAAMADFGGEEYPRMVCVESGNVAPNQLTLGPGRSSSLKVTISSAAC